jgi:radical SAM superfamily enzyme YgiQ (UPF0313 family)
MTFNLKYSQRGNLVTTFISLGDIRASGIRIISAVLKQKGWPSNTIIYKLGYSMNDIPTKREENILIGLLKDLKTDIVGITVKTPFLKIAQDITKRVKKELDASVIWGGSHPTILPEESLNNADIVCLGEGEYPFLEFLQNSIDGKQIDNIKNFGFKKDGNVVCNDLRPLLQRDDLDSLPSPDCGNEDKYIIHNGKVIHADPLDRAIEYYPMASRGCPFRCSFCINGILKEIYHGCGPFVRVRSPEKVVDEIVDVLQKFPAVHRIRFQDEVFPWKKDWIKKFSEEYKKRVGLPFLCTFHPNTIDEENIRMLKAAGLIVVGFGMQSPSERVRREVFHRKESNATILKSIEILHRNKLEGFYDLILDNPFETEEDKKKGLDFMLKIPKPFNIAPFSLKFFPGYQITEDALKQRKISESEMKEIGSEGYFEMSFNWYSPKKKEDILWNCLYILSSRSTFPRFLVRFFSKWEFLKRHSNLIVAVVKLNWYPELFVIGMRRLIRGQLSPTNFFRVIKSRVLKETI